MNPESYSDDGVEIVKIHIASNLTGAFGLNYSEFPKSCRGNDFALMRARILELLDVGWEGERNVG